jgi:hypothetical protein
MSLKIKANSLTTQRYLEVDSGGVVFCETALAGGRRRFQFHQIDLVLMSPDNHLSFQVGLEVFRLPIKPNKKAHQDVINALVQEVSRAR